MHVDAPALLCLFLRLPQSACRCLSLLQVPVTVVYLDRSESFGAPSDSGDMSANVHQIISITNDDDERSKVSKLLMTGHMPNLLRHVP
eukprot:1147097-Pelagomonas_calceolata.AAC.3